MIIFVVDRSLIVGFLLLLLVRSSSRSFTILYNTADSTSAQYYDCVYYIDQSNSIVG